MHAMLAPLRQILEEILTGGVDDDRFRRDAVHAANFVWALLADHAVPNVG